MKRSFAALVSLAALATPGVASAYLPEPDAWSEGIYVLDGAAVCLDLTIDDEDKATCNEISDFDRMWGPNFWDVLHYAQDRLDRGAMGDEYIDTLIVMSDWDQQLGDALAFYSDQCNDIQGTGRAMFPCGALRASGIINMNASDRFPADYNASYAGYSTFFDVLGEEVEHQVGIFLRLPDLPRDELLGRQGAHWSFFVHTDGGVLEGNKWRDDGNGTFYAVDIDGGYHAADQYLWGFRPPEEVPEMFVLRPDWDGFSAGLEYPIQPPTARPTDSGPCSSSVDCTGRTFTRVCVRPECEARVDCEEGQSCVPGQFGFECDDMDPLTDDGRCEILVDRVFGRRPGTRVRGITRDFTIEDIVQQNRARDPSFFESPKFTREWFVWFTRPGEIAPETTECLEGRFDRVVRMRREWPRYFYEQTDFRGRVLTHPDLVEELPLWEWGLKSEGYVGGGGISAEEAVLPEEDALERWTYGGSHASDPKVRERDPISCATDADCDEGQRCVRRACQGTDRYLHLETEAGDAYVQSPELRIPVEFFNAARITMNAYQGGHVMVLQWKTGDETEYSDDRSVSFPISGDGVRRVHTALLLPEDGWEGIVTGLRLHPGDDAGAFDIDRVELLLQEVQRYCVGPEDSSCGGCPVGQQCRDGDCKSPIPCATRQCVLPPGSVACMSECDDGWVCVDGSCQIPKPCEEACECGDDEATCEEVDPCPSGWSCDVVVPDRDGDGFLDEEDNCRDLPNPSQIDADGDGIGDDCQDLDGDGVVNQEDNCPSITNSQQGDADGDGMGDACDGDFEYDVGCTCRAVAGRPSGLLVLAVLGLLFLRRRSR